MGMTTSAAATTQRVASGFVFKIAERCNLNCSYCYNDARRFAVGKGAHE